MWTVLRWMAVVLAFLLLGAHFLRGGHVMVVALLLAAPIVGMLVRRRWMRRLLQVLLVLGAGVWLLTANAIYGSRLEAGEPYGRMLIIMFAVATFTLFAAAVVPMPGERDVLKAKSG
ncbi:MAG: hypothetical protein IT445_01945 [Phycisphaeraceae bacterium]|nr:hypothetical protein [Phycisphaeraceae bacterium]